MRIAGAIASPPLIGRDAEKASSAVLFSLRRTTLLTVALLVVVVVAAVYGIFRAVHGNPFHQQLAAWCTCGMLVCMAITILLVGRYVMQRSLSHVESQLRVLAREERLEPVSGHVPDELSAVMSALSDYVGRVRERVDRLRLQKKELDIQMRAAEAQHRHTEAIIFSISEAVIVVDMYGELVLANAASERLFGFRLIACRHRPIERVIADTALVSLIKEARAVTTGNPRRQVEYSLMRDGHTQTFNITLSAVLDAGGDSRGVVAVFHDVTRDREIAQIKTDFVSAVSHELRTPLSSIKAYTEMLLDGEAQDEKTREDFHRIIQSETDRLQRLISKILDISRMESGVMEVRRAMVQPNDVVQQVLEMVAPQAREKQMTVTCELGEGLPSIEADRDLVYQAVQNVVSNALKYTRPSGQVSVRTGVDEEAQRFTVTVADNGLGIRSEDMPRIFDKFFRARDSAAAAKGTGLGLNLVKHIVETVHGGEISVASEHGVGTTMVLRFPLKGVEARHGH